MNNKELIEKKNCGDCICDGCERRFVCWTTKRVFSEPTHQALYEAYIAEGHSHEDAVKEVEDAIQRAIMKAAMHEVAKNPPVTSPPPDSNKKWQKPWSEWLYEIPSSPYDKWTCSDFNKAIPIEEAKEGIKDLTKYYRSMISAKSTD